MIAMRESGERIRRRYPATLKTMGRGTLYITTRRVVFESDSHGVCLELHFKHLFEWYPIARRKCRLSWHEPDPKTKDVRLTDKPFECEITLERRSDKWKPDPIEFHYALCFAYTEWVDHKDMQEGWYWGADDKIRNHWRVAGPKQKTVDEYPGDVNLAFNWPRIHHAADTRKEMNKYFRGASGERIVDQEYKWRGWDRYEDGNHDLKPKMAWPNTTVQPYEQEYEKIKEYYPDWRAPTFEEMADRWQIQFRKNMHQAALDRARKDVKHGKLIRGSKKYNQLQARLNTALAEYVRDYKIAKVLTEMKPETPGQWSKIYHAGLEAFKKSGIRNHSDGDVIVAYDLPVIDMPPPEPYKNEELEEMHNYRRLLVEAA